MADTANYGWHKPTPLGDSGAWGTKLNTAFDDIDVDLKAVSDAADAAQDDADVGVVAAAENIGFLSMMMATWAQFLGGLSTPVMTRVSPHVHCSISGSSGNVSMLVPVPGLAAGMQVTGWRVVAKNGSGTNQVIANMYQYDDAGAQTIVGSYTSGNLTGSYANYDKSGLTHTVVAGRGYYFYVSFEASGLSANGDILSIRPIVVRP